METNFRVETAKSIWLESQLGHGKSQVEAARKIAEKLLGRLEKV